MRLEALSKPESYAAVTAARLHGYHGDEGIAVSVVGILKSPPLWLPAAGSRRCLVAVGFYDVGQFGDAGDGRAVDWRMISARVHGCSSRRCASFRVSAVAGDSGRGRSRGGWEAASAGSLAAVGRAGAAEGVRGVPAGIPAWVVRRGVWVVHGDGCSRRALPGW